MAKILDSELERLKKEVAIERLVMGFGVELKRHGAELIGTCPFHEDKTPSLVVSPKTNLMSKAELNATSETRLLRGGREGTHFVSDSVNNSAVRAQERLALPVKPEVKAVLEVPSGKFSSPTRVGPLPRPSGGTLPGGGMERTATGPIPVSIVRVKKY